MFSARLWYLSGHHQQYAPKKEVVGSVEGCEDPFNRPRSDSSADDNECVSVLNASLLCKYFVDYHCTRPRGWKQKGGEQPLCERTREDCCNNFNYPFSLAALEPGISFSDQTRSLGGEN
jgi:hypothetical protein